VQPTGPYAPAITLAFATAKGATATTPTGATVGAGTFQISASGGMATVSDLQVITGPLPVATSVSLTTGTWYSFSVRTSFLQGAMGSQGDVISLLQTMGFGLGGTATAPTLYVVPATQSSPGVAITDPTALDTWNVIAVYSGPTAATPPGRPYTVTDGPPLLFFVPSALPLPLSASLTASGTAGSAPATGTVPSSVMP
jgi:hypothetical protein